MERRWAPPGALKYVTIQYLLAWIFLLTHYLHASSKFSHLKITMATIYIQSIRKENILWYIIYDYSNFIQPLQDRTAPLTRNLKIIYTCLKNAPFSKLSRELKNCTKIKITIWFLSYWSKQYFDCLDPYFKTNWHDWSAKLSILFFCFKVYTLFFKKVLIIFRSSKNMLISGF